MTDFSIILPLNKDFNSNQLTGIASANSVDRDDERMSDQALQMMVDDIKREGVNLFQDHSHKWDDTMGVIKDAQLDNGKVKVKIDLDDPVTNPKVPALLNKLKKGIKLGLSVGGNVTNFRWEYDKNLGKKIKVLDKVKLFEVSVVGIPSNADSYISLSQAITKSAKTKHNDSICPICHSIIGNKECSICLYEL